MKTFYKWFDRAVILFLVIIPILTFLPFIYLIEQKTITNGMLIDHLDHIMSVLFFLNVIVGIIYFITAITFFITNHLKKKKEKAVALKILVKGIIIFFIPFGLGSICSLLGLCGLAL